MSVNSFKKGFRLKERRDGKRPECGQKPCECLRKEASVEKATSAWSIPSKPSKPSKPVPDVAGVKPRDVMHLAQHRSWGGSQKPMNDAVSAHVSGYGSLKASQHQALSAHHTNESKRLRQISSGAAATHAAMHRSVALAHAEAARVAKSELGSYQIISLSDAAMENAMEKAMGSSTPKVKFKNGTTVVHHGSYEIKKRPFDSQSTGHAVLYTPKGANPGTAKTKNIGGTHPTFFQATAAAKQHHAQMSAKLAKSLKKPGARGGKYYYDKSFSQQEMMMSDTYENLFKSELAVTEDKVLIECPHCDAPITKSEVLAKAKMAATGNVSHDNKDGGHHKGPSSGDNSATPVRSVKAAKKTDKEVMVGKGEDEPELEKADESEEDNADVAVAKAVHGAILAGSRHVQYVAGDDAEIAKAIEEGQLGQGAVTRPPLNVTKQ